MVGGSKHVDRVAQDWDGLDLDLHAGLVGAAAETPQVSAGSGDQEEDVNMVDTASSSAPAPVRPGGVLACVGCGGLVPDVAGPTHPYMQASPGCWQIYGEVGARWHGEGGAGPARSHHVDAYAVQHPGGAEWDRRQRQSVAVHLVALCSLLEMGQPLQQAPVRRGRAGQVVLGRLGLADWPYLTPPRDVGAVTVTDVHAARIPVEQETRAAAWLESAWTAWADHHQTVRAWAGLLREAHP